MDHLLLSLIKELEADTEQILSLLKDNDIESAEIVIARHLLLSEKIKKLIDDKPEYKIGLDDYLSAINSGTISIIAQLEFSKAQVVETLSNINKACKAADLYRATVGDI